MSLAKNVEFLRHFPKLNGFNGLGIYGRSYFAGGQQSAGRNQRIRHQSRRAQDVRLRAGALPRAPALVVVLHGCGQTAAGYDLGTGWSTLAKRYGFALLMPEQQASNNANTCFNWFNPGDIARGRGEAASIRQMIARMVADHEIDPRRIYITGLSAGGAMTSVMLATYPEVFAGGAIIAGLPFGIASNVREALSGMMQSTSRPAGKLGDLVRKASKHKGPWPKVSVWHGSADRTVNPGNANEIVKQWLDVHGLPPAPMSAGRCRRLSARGLVERRRRDRRRILHHHRHGPRHAAGLGRQRRALWRGRRVPDRGGNFVVLSHREFLRPDRARQPAQRSGQAGVKAPKVIPSAATASLQSPDLAATLVAAKSRTVRVRHARRAARTEAPRRHRRRRASSPAR